MNERLLSKLVTLTRRLEEIDRMLAAPDVASDTVCSTSPRSAPTSNPS